MIEYNKEIKIHKHKKHGYIRFYDPAHPLADSAGLVYLHRHIASLKIGRWLERKEDAHHIDHNKENNNPENIIVLATHGEHTLLHAKEKGWSTPEKISCQICGKTFTAIKKRNRRFCSLECALTSKRRIDIPKEILEKLVWEKPTSEIAKELGVSDTGIAKRCKVLNIKKPPRGYWQKLQSIEDTV